MASAKNEKEIERGLLQVYTGDGKGKTTAAMGTALRAAGHGLKVCIIQFLKGGGFTGESIAFKKFKNVEYYQFGPSASYAGKVKAGKKGVGKEFFTYTQEDLENARKALALAEKKMSSGKYSLVVLDELNVAINFGHLKLKDAISVLKKRHPKTEVIVTGRGAKKEIKEMADLVTEMTLVKHPFQKGILARWGIDY